MSYFCTVHTVKSGLYVDSTFVTRFKTIINNYSWEKKWNNSVIMMTDCGMEDQRSNPCTSRNISLYGNVQTA